MQLYRPMLDSVRDSGRVLMMQTLDSSQQAKFKALIEHNKRTADSVMRTREGNK